MTHTTLARVWMDPAVADAAADRGLGLGRHFAPAGLGFWDFGGGLGEVIGGGRLRAAELDHAFRTARARRIAQPAHGEIVVLRRADAAHLGHPGHGADADRQRLY